MLSKNYQVCYVCGNPIDRGQIAVYTRDDHDNERYRHNGCAPSQKKKALAMPGDVQK